MHYYATHMVTEICYKMFRRLSHLLLHIAFYVRRTLLHK